MKGIYKNSLVEILEKEEKKTRIQTYYGEINVPASEVLPVSNKVYCQYAAELNKIDEYIENIRKKQEEIKQRYYAKKDELDRLSAKAWHRKQELLRDMSLKATLEA